MLGGGFVGWIAGAVYVVGFGDVNIPEYRSRLEKAFESSPAILGAFIGAVIGAFIGAWIPIFVIVATVILATSSYGGKATEKKISLEGPKKRADYE